MQEPSVSVSFLWAMIVVAFVVGLIVQGFTFRAERRELRGQLKLAAVLLGEACALARIRGSIPTALHRRVADFRARFGL